MPNEFHNLDIRKIYQINKNFLQFDGDLRLIPNFRVILIKMEERNHLYNLTAIKKFFYSLTAVKKNIQPTLVAAILNIF